MPEKISIVKQIDKEKLNEKISNFVYENRYNPYIFMNNTTLQSLYKDDTYQKWDGSLYYCSHIELIKMHHLYRMFEDNTLDFGEIELR